MKEKTSFNYLINYLVSDQVEKTRTYSRFWKELGLLIMLVGIVFGTKTIAAEPVNHYIVLFDASGSIKRDFAGTKRQGLNFWQNRISDSASMAKRLSALVNKALQEPPAGFPSIKPNDLFSFMLFRLNYNHPAYQPPYLFLTNGQVKLHQGLPRSGDYEAFDFKSITGKKGTISLSQAFRGFSPIVAATTAALPFLGKAIGPQNQLIKHTYIVRITDGSYNAETNGADEYSVILRHIETEKRKGEDTRNPEGYEQFRELAKRVSSAFDIGAKTKDCILKTHQIKNPLSQTFNCQDDAFNEIKTIGKGFLISYMKVIPRRPSPRILAHVAKQQLEFQREVRDENIVYVDTNLIQAATSGEDGSSEQDAFVVYPVLTDWKLGEEDEWKECVIDQNGIEVQCHGKDNQVLLTNREGQIHLTDDGSTFQEKLYYRFHYQQTFTGNEPLYPFNYALQPEEFPVSLSIDSSSLPKNNLYYPPPPGAETSSLLGLSVFRAMTMRGKDIEPQQITDEILLRLAKSDDYKDKILTPQKLAEDSKVRVESYKATVDSHNSRAIVLYAVMLGALFFTWLFWPRRKLNVEEKNLAKEGLMLDFNSRQHEQIVLIGLVEVYNIARTLNQKTFNLELAVAKPRFSLFSDEFEDVPLKIEEHKKLVAIGGPGEDEIEDKKSTDGKEYPLFFDPSAIQDCYLPAPSSGHEVQMAIHVALQEKKNKIWMAIQSILKQVDTRQKDLNYDLKLLLHPEKDDMEVISPKIQEEDKQRVIKVEHQNDTQDYEICAYYLKNTTHYHYSWPAQGSFHVVAENADGSPLRDLVCLVMSRQDSSGKHCDENRAVEEPHEDPVAELPYVISHGETLRMSVVIDFTRIQNPIDQDTYRVRLYHRISQNGETRNITEDEWQLLVFRSSQRTEVSMRVIDRQQRESLALHKDRLHLAGVYPVGTKEHPILVHTESGRRKNSLFTLRLANACRNGHGFASWKCRLKPTSKQHLQFPDQALRLVNQQGGICEEGRLRDSSDEAERSMNLKVKLDTNPRHLKIFRPSMILSLNITVDWEVYEDGDNDLEKVRCFTTEITLRCNLKHQPPNHVLAIDFGTSALAIAHAIGPTPVLLPLQDQLQETAKIHRLDDPNGHSPFLCSECNVNAVPERLKELRPEDEDFLVLPLLEDTVRTAPEKVFLSLKALISAGLDTLPLNRHQPEHQHQYKGEDGTLTTEDPPLEKVIEGAYRGLMKHYVKPILDNQKKNGFSHVLITHPNTYTPNHVEELRRIVERVLVGSPYVSPPNVIYKENINFFSESDAVAFYYLVHTLQLHGNDWSRVPDHESILVYDIGAGTLDLTHLEVHWEAHGDTKTPKKIKIKRRSGTNRAGNLLDECIARDLHQHLMTVLNNDRYANPIVISEGPPSKKTIMDGETRFTMDKLREEIHSLKVRLSEGESSMVPSPQASKEHATGEGVDLAQHIKENSLSDEEVMADASLTEDIPPLSVLLTPRGINNPIVKYVGARTAKLYEDCSNITVITVQGRENVYWTPTRDQVLNGTYVKAFLEQVTRKEIYDFFSHRIPKIDTLIISGRSSLWPDFEDRLKTSLGSIPNWVSFNRNSQELKQAVVLGVLERQFRWQDLVVEDPGIIGQFVVFYEKDPHKWHYQPFIKSGDSHEFYLGNSAEVRIGILTNNGFNKCFSFTPSDYYSVDKKLVITLDFDLKEKGILKAKVENSRGEYENIDEGSVSVLSYVDRPWPLGVSKLLEMPPEKVVRRTE